MGIALVGTMASKQRGRGVNDRCIRVGVCVAGSPIARWLPVTLKEFNHVRMEFIEIRLTEFPRRRLAHRLYSRVENRAFRTAQKSTPPDTGEVLYAEAIELGDVPVSGLDLVICSGEHTDLFLDAQFRFGTWTVVLSASGRSSRTAPGFWESLQALPVTESRLECNLGDRRLLLDRTFSPTYLLSPAVNLNSVACSAAAMLNRQLRSLIEAPDTYIETSGAEVSVFRYEHDEPGIVDLLRFFIVQISRLLREYVHKKFYWVRWRMRYRIGDSDFQEISQPEDEFWADPSLVSSDGSTYLFFEVYTRKRERGHLSVMKWHDDHWGEPEEVLLKDFHLSYPHVIETDGSFYMVPETKKTGCIQLYACEEFPRQWRFVVNLMENIKAADTTLFLKDGLWWMFTCITEGYERGCENTHLFYSESLESTDWKPHPLNPIVSDARAGRPAGEIYQEDGRWFRPVQNSCYDYGYGLSLYEICEISKTTYQEKQVLSLFPESLPDSRGIHAWTRRGDITVIDSMEQLSRF